MALIPCKECGTRVSDQAQTCPQCGCPVIESANIAKQNDALIIEVTQNPNNTTQYMMSKELSEKTGIKFSDAQEIIRVYKMSGINLLNKSKDDLPPKPKKKKESALSTWAAILSLFGCTTIIAVILAIIDISKNDKEKKHNGSVFAIVMGVLYFWVFFVYSPSDTGTIGSSEKQLNILLCQDENVRIYLDHIKNGQIFVRYCNDTDENINIKYEELIINGDRYYSGFFVEEVYSHDEDVVKLSLYDKEGSSQSYTYDSGTIKGSFSYFTGGIGFTTELEFDEISF